LQLKDLQNFGRPLVLTAHRDHITDYWFKEITQFSRLENGKGVGWVESGAKSNTFSEAVEELQLDEFQLASPTAELTESSKEVELVQEEIVKKLKTKSVKKFETEKTQVVVEEKKDRDVEVAAEEIVERLVQSAPTVEEKEQVQQVSEVHKEEDRVEEKLEERAQEAPVAAEAEVGQAQEATPVKEPPAAARVAEEPHVPKASALDKSSVESSSSAVLADSSVGVEVNVDTADDMSKRYTSSSARAG
jgi:hypothetical protein